MPHPFRELVQEMLDITPDAMRRISRGNGDRGRDTAQRTRDNTNDIQDHDGNVHNDVNSNNGPVREYEVGRYEDLKRREQTGDGLEHDHIPSKQALKLAAQRKAAREGKTLSEADLRRIENRGISIEIMRDLHVAGRTWGSKNKALADVDSQDLGAAMWRDLQAHWDNLVDKEDVDLNGVLDQFAELVRRNKEAGIDIGDV
ncbi:hypothetical protein [Georgenia alba]|uniref:Uncharacterized protein n=1 Tax=Georgenia alba TaxID=2233858 RepID=A0ABW2Q4Y3_9MICO